MNKIGTIIAVLCALLNSAVAEDDSSLSGIKLERLCNDVVGSSQDNLCVAYIIRVTQGIALGMSEAKREHVYCVPDNVSGGKIREIVQKYLRDHPENLDLPAQMLIALAIHMAFPCPNSN
jgi:Rap1a immunity proteins